MTKRKRASLVALAVMCVAVLGLAAAVYAKYISSITKTGTATVAKWAFSQDNTSGTITCPTDLTYDTDTLVSGKIAPGTYGKCPIEISNANTEVGIRYEIKPSAVTNQPKNLKLYSDAEHTSPVDTTTGATGTLDAKAAATTVYIYWEWPYEGASSTYDTDDTSDGESAQTMTITFDVTGTQVQPSV